VEANVYKIPQKQYRYYGWWHGRNLKRKSKMTQDKDIIEELKGLYLTWEESQPHVAMVALKAMEEIIKLRNPKLRQRAWLTTK
jgi:hypothetical protein